jgi:hypothetical protein
MTVTYCKFKVNALQVAVILHAPQRKTIIQSTVFYFFARMPRSEEAASLSRKACSFILSTLIVMQVTRTFRGRDT